MEEKKPIHIQIIKNGPIVIKGSFVLKDSAGNITYPDEVLICRCGESKVMPLCDCSHGKIPDKNQ